MRDVLFIVFSVVLILRWQSPLSISVEPTDESVDNAMQKLQGIWIPVYTETKSGKNYEIRDRLSIGPKGVFIFGDTHGTIQGVVVIDPNAKPKLFNFRYKEDGKEKVILCIYDVDGDTLRLCSIDEGAKRPTAFPKATESKENYALRVFKRAKSKP